jgi:hypothetical protein
MNFPTETYVGAHSQAYRDVGQAYVNAAQTEAQAKTKMVSDLVQGALTGIGAYKQGVTAKKDFAAGRAAVESPVFQKMFGLDEKSGAQFGQLLDTMEKNQGIDAANRFMQGSLPTMLKYGLGQQDFMNQMELQRLKNQGAVDVAGMRPGGGGGGLGPIPGWNPPRNSTVRNPNDPEDTD